MYCEQEPATREHIPAFSHGAVKHGSIARKKKKEKKRGLRLDLTAKHVCYNLIDVKFASGIKNINFGFTLTPMCVT